MIFFNKKKKITLDCFTCNPSIAKNTPIDNANKFYPEWWKKMASKTKDEKFGIEYNVATIKRCDGIIEQYKKGFVIPLWSDIIIETNDQKEYRYVYSSEENSAITFHGSRQLGPVLGKHIHMKLQSPWYIKEKSGVKFVFNPAVYNLADYFFQLQIPTAIVDFKSQYGTHINMFLPNKTNRIEIPAGTGLAHYIPIEDIDVKLNIEILSISEWQQLDIQEGYMTHFMGRYKKANKKNEQ